MRTARRAALPLIILILTAALLTAALAFRTMPDVLPAETSAAAAEAGPAIGIALGAAVTYALFEGFRLLRGNMEE